jgi:hypothetical protein
MFEPFLACVPKKDFKSFMTKTDFKSFMTKKGFNTYLHEIPASKITKQYQPSLIQSIFKKNGTGE